MRYRSIHFIFAMYLIIRVMVCVHTSNFVVKGRCLYNDLALCTMQTHCEQACRSATASCSDWRNCCQVVTHLPAALRFCFRRSHWHLAEQLIVTQTAALIQLVAMLAGHTDPDSLLEMDCSGAVSRQGEYCLLQLQTAHMLRCRRRSKWAGSGTHLAAKERSSFCMQK